MQSGPWANIREKGRGQSMAQRCRKIKRRESSSLISGVFYIVIVYLQVTFNFLIVLIYSILHINDITHDTACLHLRPSLYKFAKK